MNCRTCAGPCCLKGSNHEGDCEGYKPQTHYEQIKAMSVEEIAEFLVMIPYCGGPTTSATDGSYIGDGLRTKMQWLNWLKQEVTK